MANALQRGRGGGLTGILDLPGLSAKFEVRVYKWKARLTGSTRPRRGRGGGFFKTVRWMMSDGNIAVVGQLPPNAVSPVPDAWKGQTGTLTVQPFAGKTIAYPIIVNEHGFDYEEGKTDIPDVSLGLGLTGTPAYTGWTLASATDPSKSDQQQWDGTSFTKDPNALQSSAVIAGDWWGTVTDSNAGDVAKLGAIISAWVASYTGMKLRQITLMRDAPDGGTWTQQEGLTDTVDDVQMPATNYTKDAGANEIWGQVDIRKVQADATVSWPSTPTDPANLKHGTVDKVQLNDGKWALTYHFIRNDSTDAIELPRTKTTTDINDIDDSAKIAKVNNSATPPSPPSAPVGTLLEHSTEELTTANGGYTGFWVHTFFYGPTTRLQKITFQGDTVVDPSHIQDAQKITVVNGSSTAPGTPTPTNTDLQLTKRTSTRFQGTPEQWTHTFDFARNTGKDEREQTKRHADPDNFDETESRPVLHTSPTSAPTTPTPDNTNTTQVIGTDVERVCVASGAFTGLWLWTFIFGSTTEKQKIEQDGELAADSSSLEFEDVQTLTGTSVTPPSAPGARISGQVLISTKSRKLQNTPEKWRHTFTYGWRTTKQDFEYLKSLSTAEPGNVRKEEKVVKVLGTATPVTDNTYNPDTTNLEFWTDEVYRYTSTQYIHVITYRPLSPLNETQESFKQIADDPNGKLLGADRRRITDANATTAAPSVTAVDGQAMVCTKRITQKIGHTLYQHDYWYDFRSNADQKVADKTVITVDVSAIESEAVTAEVFLISGGAVGADKGTGYTPFTNAVSISYTDFTVENPLYTLRAYRWGYVTEQQKREYAETDYTADTLDVYKYRSASIITSATAISTLGAALLAANQSDKTFISALLKRFNPNKVLEILEFTGEDQKWHSFSGSSHWQLYRGRPTGGFGSTNSLMLVYPNGAGGSGILSGNPSMIPFLETTDTFRLRRRIVTNTPGDYLYVGSERTVNADPFGPKKTGAVSIYPAYTVMFQNSEELFSEAISGAHVLVVDYLFKYSQVTFDDGSLMSGHFNMDLLPNDRIYCRDLLTTFGLSGFYNPLLYAGPHAIVRWPQATSFSVFTA